MIIVRLGVRKGLEQGKTGVFFGVPLGWTGIFVQETAVKTKVFSCKSREAFSLGTPLEA